jgi:hypothetical protein
MKILSEKMAIEASRVAGWRPPLLIFHWVVGFFPVMSNFSTQAPVLEVMLRRLNGRPPASQLGGRVF